MAKKQKPKDQPPVEWRNRIVGHADVDPKTIKRNPLNWREHGEFQRAAMSGVLDEIGFVQAIVINVTTGNLLDGHMRVDLSEERGIGMVPVTYVELTLAEERKILASLDPIAALADANNEMQQQLLAEMETQSRGLAQLFDMLDDGSGKTMLQPVSDGGSEDRNLGEASKQVKPVLYVNDIATFEAAILATGERNRGKALIEICRVYLEQTKRQLDI